MLRIKTKLITVDGVAFPNLPQGISYSIISQTGNIVEVMCDDDPELHKYKRWYIWHYTEITNRVVIPTEIKKDWLDKYKENEIVGTYPDIAALLEYVKTMDAEKIFTDEAMYFYVNNILPEHEYILNYYGAIIEENNV